MQAHPYFKNLEKGFNLLQRPLINISQSHISHIFPCLVSKAIISYSCLERIWANVQNTVHAGHVQQRWEFSITGCPSAVFLKASLRMRFSSTLIFSTLQSCTAQLLIRRVLPSCFFFLPLSVGLFGGLRVGSYLLRIRVIVDYCYVLIRAHIYVTIMPDNIVLSASGEKSQKIYHLPFVIGWEREIFIHSGTENYSVCPIDPSRAKVLTFNI